MHDSFVWRVVRLGKVGEGVHMNLESGICCDEDDRKAANPGEQQGKKENNLWKNLKKVGATREKKRGN